MSDTVKTWDIGDSDPGQDVTTVVTVDITDEECRGISFGRTYAEDEWKGYLLGGKVYYSWAELVRRFGPVRNGTSS
ncbi:hypothetical protein ACT89R_01795 [Rhodococcus qingshengii]